MSPRTRLSVKHKDSREIIECRKKEKRKEDRKGVKQRTNNIRQKTNVVKELEAIRGSQNLEKSERG
jgi:hypothetical protein